MCALDAGADIAGLLPTSDTVDLWHACCAAAVLATACRHSVECWHASWQLAGRALRLSGGVFGDACTGGSPCTI